MRIGETPKTVRMPVANWVRRLRHYPRLLFVAIIIPFLDEIVTSSTFRHVNFLIECILDCYSLPALHNQRCCNISDYFVSDKESVGIPIDQTLVISIRSVICVL